MSKRWHLATITKDCCVENCCVFGEAFPGLLCCGAACRSHMPSPFSNQMSTVSTRLISSARCIKQRRLSGTRASNHISLGERASLILWEDASWPDVMPTSISEWQWLMCSWIWMWYVYVLIGTYLFGVEIKWYIVSVLVLIHLMAQSDQKAFM